MPSIGSIGGFSMSTSGCPPVNSISILIKKLKGEGTNSVYSFINGMQIKSLQPVDLVENLGVSFHADLKA